MYFFQEATIWIVIILKTGFKDILLESMFTKMKTRNQIQTGYRIYSIITL